MDYISSFFVAPAEPTTAPPQPRLPDLHASIPDTNTAMEISLAISQHRLVAIVCWASSTYDDLGAQQETYDQFLSSRERCHEDFVFFKADVDTVIREEGGKAEIREGEDEVEMRRKKGERKVRGVLGVHPKVVRVSGGLSVYKRGKLIGSLEGDEMSEYGIIEKALNSVV